MGEGTENREKSKRFDEVIYINPIDGTLNYIHGFKLFAISIGYWKDEEPIAGIVYNPLEDELFYASKGNGAFRNEIPIKISNIKLLRNSLLATCWPYEKRNSLFDK